MVRRADVLKDRTWALNGRIFRWLDKARYETGGFRHVWESIQPHFEEVQATKVPQHHLETKDSVLQQITEVIREYDEGQSEEWEMPF